MMLFPSNNICFKHWHLSFFCYMSSIFVITGPYIFVPRSLNLYLDQRISLFWTEEQKEKTSAVIALSWSG